MDWSWLFPPRCVCCTRRLSSTNTTTRLIASACIRCQPRFLPQHHSLPNLDSLLSLCSYENEAAYLVKIAKYTPHAPLLHQFGCALNQIANQQNFLPNFDAVLAAPSHPKLLIRRGLNPASMIAAPLANALSIPLLEPFVRQSNRKPQATLPWRRRQRSLKRMITCRQLLPSRVLIIDDVFTSGATLKVLASVARDHGAREVHGIVLCRATTAVTNDL